MVSYRQEYHVLNFKVPERLDLKYSYHQKNPQTKTKQNNH